MLPVSRERLHNSAVGGALRRATRGCPRARHPGHMIEGADVVSRGAVRALHVRFPYGTGLLSVLPIGQRVEIDRPRATIRQLDRLADPAV